MTSAARTVWLASYPKSGNTWVRAVVTALGTHPHLFGVDHLVSGAQPQHVGAALGAYGLDPRWLSGDELDVLRDALCRRMGAGGPGDPPVLRKTHERYRPGMPGREPFPADATRAAILVVRDPRDVACSFAPFFDVTIDEAIAAMARDGGEPEANAAQAQTASPWGTWSTHAMSWLSDDVPFPVHLVRYEDLQSDAAGTLQPVLEAVGLPCTPDTLAAAVEQARFDRLQESEATRGFKETSPRTRQFFRSGRSGGWHNELAAGQAAAIVDAHADAMRVLGYLPADDPLHLPAALGIRVRSGSVPAGLADAVRPRPWIQVTPTAALLRFRGGAGLLVEDGTDVTVDAGTGQADQVGWMVQGWAVTLAMLQRGLLSLHASTVVVGGHVLAIAGDRGAGKSTTSMALRTRGHRLLCDDVTVVEFRDGGAWTTPFWRNVHLLEDAAAAVGVDFALLPALGSGRVKSAFRAEDPADVPQRLERIVVLAPGDSDEAVRVEHPAGAARLATLVAHTSRDGVAPVVLGQERYFAQVAHLADVVPITVVHRPRSGWSLDAVLDAIEADADGPGSDGLAR
ncbi:MAG: sulfotransferase domain-containing protein [Acidimicrobiales bacterium]|nr:sulfotransferase domain-containing protein [Acidimicrobiales bacterium]